MKGGNVSGEIDIIKEAKHTLNVSREKHHTHGLSMYHA